MRRRESGRLLELPILGAILVVAGLSLVESHPIIGSLIAALPVVLWLGLLTMQFVARVTIGARRGRVVRERLAALRAEGFDPRFVCEGDLARGDAWAAFDPAKGEVKALSEDGVRSYELSRLTTVWIDTARRLGDPTPLYYSLSLHFDDPSVPTRGAAQVSIVTTSWDEAEIWKNYIDTLTAPHRPPGPKAAA